MVKRTKGLLLAYAASLLLPALGGCASKSYFINTNANRDETGNYIIRWEVEQGVNGEVELYASDDINRYPTKPFARKDIRAQSATYVTEDLYSRKFFLLVFNGRQSVITGAREITTDAITNMRDIGGMPTLSDRRVRWGMLYRSAQLHDLSNSDVEKLNRLGIKSQIYLSNYESGGERPIVLSGARSFVLPADKTTDTEGLLQGIFSDRVSPSEVRSLQNALMSSYAYNNTRQYAQALNMLLDRSNYPVLLSDEFGKDRVAFLTMLIQQVLDLSRSSITDEYLMSNSQLPVARIVPRGYLYPHSTQESLTEYFRSRSNDLNNIISDIVNKYGSVSNYLSRVLNFGPEKQARLAEILLE